VVGYSYFELSFIPNGFEDIFPVYYREISLQPFVFTFGNQNLITNLGSIIEFFIAL